MKLLSLALILCCFSLSAWSRVDFEQLNCFNEDYHLYIKRVDLDKMKVSVFDMEVQNIFYKTAKQAKVYADNLKVPYKETASGITSSFTVDIGRGAAGNKTKKIKISLKEKSGKIVAIYNESPELKCQ